MMYGCIATGHIIRGCVDVGTGEGRPADLARQWLIEVVVVCFLVTVYMTRDRLCLVLLVMNIFGTGSVQLLLWSSVFWVLIGRLNFLTSGFRLGLAKFTVRKIRLVGTLWVSFLIGAKCLLATLMLIR